MRVVWTDAAFNQLVAIRDYLEETSPDYARSVVDRLVSRSEQVAVFPRSARMVPEYEIDDVRQIIEGSYRIIYLIKEKQVDVLAVIHTSRGALPQDD